MVLTLVACGSEEKPRETDQSASRAAGPATATEAATRTPDEICDALIPAKTATTLFAGTSVDPARSSARDQLQSVGHDAYLCAFGQVDHGEWPVEVMLRLAESPSWCEMTEYDIKPLPSLGEGACLGTDLGWEDAFTAAIASVPGGISGGDYDWQLTARAYDDAGLDQAGTEALVEQIVKETQGNVDKAVG